MITYQVERYYKVIDELKPLFESHWDEVSGNPEIPLNPDYNRYLDMDKLEILHMITAREDGKVIGYHVSFVLPHMHYKQSITCFSDIFFIDKAHRQGFVGIKLFKFLEESLKEKNVQRIYMGTKLKLDIGPILDRLGYKAIERTYTKMIG